MSASKDKGERTFNTVRDKYDRWSETAPPRRAARRDPNGGVSAHTEELINRVAVGFAVILGIAWVALAAYTAFKVVPGWIDIDRSGAVVGYVVVAFFLALAGFGAIIASLNHLLHVLNPERRAQHGHH